MTTQINGGVGGFNHQQNALRPSDRRIRITIGLHVLVAFENPKPT